jgi:hypothetical protein
MALELEESDTVTPDTRRPPVDERAAAKYLGNFSVAALRLWRRKKRGPTFVRIGRSIRYLPDDLDLHLRQHRVEPRGRS